MSYIKRKYKIAEKEIPKSDSGKYTNVFYQTDAGKREKDEY
jgi:hypothetical protein